MNVESVCQIVEALKKSLDDENIYKEYFITDDLNEVVKNETVIYYGIMTVGENTNARLRKNDKNIITVTAGSQIIDYFDEVIYEDDALAVVAIPEGHFRGWKINI